MTDPVLWGLGASTLATVYLLFERRARAQRQAQEAALDAWAGTRGLQLERELGAAALTGLEPLALMPSVVAVERMLRGRVRARTSPAPGGEDALAVPAAPVAEVVLDAWLGSCRAGARRPSRRFLLAGAAASRGLPPMRVLPIELTVRDGQAEGPAPGHLGFLPMPAPDLPDEYRAEAFQPLRRTIVAAVASALRAANPGLRVELRPGHVLCAREVSTSDLQAGGIEKAADELLRTAIDLSLRLHQALPPEHPEAEAAGPPPGGA